MEKLVQGPRSPHSLATPLRLGCVSGLPADASECLSKLHVHHTVYKRVNACMHTEQISAKIVHPLCAILRTGISQIDDEVGSKTAEETGTDGNHHLRQSDLATEPQ